MELQGLLKIIDKSIKQIPSLKYALGVLAVVSIVAIIVSFRIDYRVAIFGTIFVLFMSAVILLFSKLSNIDSSYFKIPAIIFLWFSVAITIIISSLLITSVFFKYPLDLSHLLNPKTETETTIDNTQEIPAQIAETNELDFVDVTPPDIGQISFLHQWNNKLIIGASSPNELLITNDKDLNTFHRISVNGLPKSIVTNNRFAYVATGFPSGIQTFDLLTNQSTAFHPLPIDASSYPSLNEIFDNQLPNSIESIAYANQKLWVLSYDNSNAIIYTLDLENGEYHVPSYFDHDIAFSARGWQLESIGQNIFAAETNTTPASLHRLTMTSYKEFRGHDYDLISSATGIWQSSDNTLVFISPENEIIGVDVSDNTILPLTIYGNIANIDQANWITPVAKVNGNKQYIAINETTYPSQKMLWSTLFLFENQNKFQLKVFYDSHISDIETFEDSILAIVKTSENISKLFVASTN